MHNARFWTGCTASTCTDGRVQKKQNNVITNLRFLESESACRFLVRLSVRLSCNNPVVCDTLTMEVTAPHIHTHTYIHTVAHIQAVELLPPLSSSSRSGTGIPESPKWSGCRPNNTPYKVTLAQPHMKNDAKRRHVDNYQELKSSITQLSHL